MLPSEATELERGIQEVFTQGSGVMTLIVVTQASAASLITAVTAGDATAKVALNAADLALRQIEQRSQSQATPCLLCDGSTLWCGEAPAAVGVLTPFGIEPVRIALGMAICSDCAADRSNAELAQTVVRKLRALWLPDLRVLPTMAEAGHA